MYYLKIYDKDHTLLDEIHEFSELKYTKTLNGVGSCTFKVPMASEKCTESNFMWLNHVEVYKNDVLLWGGVIVQRSFGDSLDIGCYGYSFLLKGRRCREKDYPRRTYGELLRLMLDDANSIYDTGIRIGNIDPNSLKTQRKVDNSDNFLDKMTEYVNDCNYYFEVDNDRDLNFYTQINTSDYFKLQYGYKEGDNVVSKPSFSQSAVDMINRVYSESDTEVEGEENSNTITSEFQDDYSIGLFGLFEGTYSANNGISIQNTLDNYVIGELNRRCYPLNSVSLEVINSSLCDMSKLKIGHIVEVELKPFFNFKDNLRVIEITHNTENETYNLTVGETIFRPAKPTVKYYSK